LSVLGNNAEPAEETRIDVGKDCLVIGGGISGMTSALSLADQEINVTLVEKNDNLGGLLSKIDTMAPHEISTKEFLDDKKKKLGECDKIEVHTNSEITEINGYVGNFKVKIKEGEEEKEKDFSTIVVTTGMRELEPHGQFEFDENDKIVTQLQLEELLRKDEVKDVEIVSIINCVNSRNEERGCCNVGCLISVKNAKEILKRNPKAKVYLFYKDINIRGTEVKYFKDAIEQYDIKLVRYADDTTPIVVSENGKLIVKAHDVLIGRDLSIPSDLVVLTPPFVGNESTEKLKGLLKVSTNADGFFQEAHIKLRPLDFATQGIYLGGCTRSPKDMRESMEEAMGAAMRASIPMKKGYVEAEGIVADINYELCSDCGLCGKVCEFSAIELDEKHPTVIKAICKGCGTCAAECPKDAINIIHFTDEQILAQVEASLEENPEDKIVAFCCHWCAMGAVDMAGVGRSQYPENIRIIRVMCAGRVDKSFVQKALELGAGGVMVAGCEFPTCHYINGNYKCKERMEKLKRKMEKEGMDPNKLWTVWLSAADGPKFVKTVKNMVTELAL
jgi:heterodisulfide reductase subunit A